MPDTKGQSGVEQFEDAAETAERTSSSSRFSTIRQAPDTGGGDGTSYREYRGEPSKESAKAESKQGSKE